MNFNHTFKKTFSFTVIIFISTIFFLPFITYADVTPTTPKTAVETGITYDCQNEAIRKDAGSKLEPGDCSFEDLVLATKHVVNWAVTFTLFFSVVGLTYAGFNYMISGDNPGKRKEANGMLWSIVKGIFFILAAWMIVSLITNALLKPDVFKLG